MSITEEDIKKLRTAFTTFENAKIKSLTFHYNGELLAYNTNEKIEILKLSEKVDKFPITVKKYGCGFCKFYDEQSLLHTSTDSNENIRFLDLAKEGYIRYFPGHAKKVLNLEVGDRHIVSSSDDNTIRLWDPRQQEVVKIHQGHKAPLIALHTAVLVVATDSCTIEFFEMPNLDKCHKKFVFEKVEGVEWTSIKFSDEGKKLLVTTNSSCLLIFDATRQQELHCWRGEWARQLIELYLILSPTDYDNSEKVHIDASFTPNSQFVLSGSFEGLVHVWNCETSHKVRSLKSGYEGSCYNVAFNPKLMNLATTSVTAANESSLHLWIEKEGSIAQNISSRQV